MLVAFDDIGFGFAGEVLLQHASLQLDPGDRVAVVGRNGAGKTTLLKLLLGELEIESGRILKKPGVQIAHLRQTQEQLGSGTVLDSAMEVLADVVKLEAEMQQAAQDMATDPAAGERFSRLQDQFALRGGWSATSQAKKVLSGIGFGEVDLEKQVASLSGGEKNRLALGRLLLARADVLLLDEPTNHLDVAATEFLEGFLTSERNAGGRALLLVSHDRRFLDRVATRTALLEQTRLRVFPGGYTQARAARDAQVEQQLVEWELQQEYIKRNEEFIQKHLAGQNTKQAQSRRTQLEKLERIEKPIFETKTAAKISLRPVAQSDREVLRVDGLTLARGTRTLVNGVSFGVERGERIALAGPNGAGKSTMLEALVGKLRPEGGSVRMGGKVKLGYYDQQLSSLDGRKSVLDLLRATGVSTSDEWLRGWAGRFLFSGGEALRPVGAMSGGEKARAALAVLTASGFNFLVLDEPTNHLDIAACEALEQALNAYDGTLFMVSHDRLFLDRVTTRTLFLQDGALIDWAYPFGEARKRMLVGESAKAEAAGPSAAQNDYESQKQRERDRQKQKRRVQAIDQELSGLEKGVEKLHQQLLDPALAEAWEKLAALQKDKDSAEERMLLLMEERETLSSALA